MICGTPFSDRCVASEALIMWALLGGCNCKVPSQVCERLVALVFRLWERCILAQRMFFSGKTVGQLVIEVDGLLF